MQSLGPHAIRPDKHKKLKKLRYINTITTKSIINQKPLLVCKTNKTYIEILKLTVHPKKLLTSGFYL